MSCDFIMVSCDFIEVPSWAATVRAPTANRPITRAEIIVFIMPPKKFRFRSRIEYEINFCFNQLTLMPGVLFRLNLNEFTPTVNDVFLYYRLVLSANPTGYLIR